MRRVLVLAATLAVGGAPATSASADGIPRLDFAYDRGAKLGYVDRGRVSPRAQRVAVHDVSYLSGSRRIRAYLVLPPGSARRPAVVFVHGSGADRRELLAKAKALAARNVVA